MNREELQRKRDQAIAEVDRLDTELEAARAEEKESQTDRIFAKAKEAIKEFGFLKGGFGGVGWMEITVMAKRSKRKMGMMGMEPEEAQALPTEAEPEFEDVPHPYKLSFHSGTVAEFAQHGDMTEIIRHAGVNCWILVKESYDFVAQLVGKEPIVQVDADASP